MKQPSISLQSTAVAKWGEAAAAGFQLLPDVLLKNQTRLQLNPTEMLVLINITMHWWYADKRPFPRTTTVAARMGLEPRTVQRVLAKLKRLNLVSKVRETTPSGEVRLVCDLSGLVTKLEDLAKEDPVYISRRQQREVTDAVRL